MILFHLPLHGVRSIHVFVKQPYSTEGVLNHFPVVVYVHVIVNKPKVLIDESGHQQRHFTSGRLNLILKAGDVPLQVAELNGPQGSVYVKNTIKDTVHRYPFLHYSVGVAELPY